MSDRGTTSKNYGLGLHQLKGDFVGRIYISTDGSFPGESFEVCANDGGHANAIQRVIQWLNDRLPSAIEKDHKLHAKGDVPPGAWFGKGSAGDADNCEAL